MFWQNIKSAFNGYYSSNGLITILTLFSLYLMPLNQPLITDYPDHSELPSPRRRLRSVVLFARQPPPPPPILAKRRVKNLQLIYIFTVGTARYNIITVQLSVTVENTITGGFGNSKFKKKKKKIFLPYHWNTYVCPRRCRPIFILSDRHVEEKRADDEVPVAILCLGYIFFYNTNFYLSLSLSL